VLGLRSADEVVVPSGDVDLAERGGESSVLKQSNLLGTTA
jgi:hypothetical protein